MAAKKSRFQMINSKTPSLTSMFGFQRHSVLSTIQSLDTSVFQIPTVILCDVIYGLPTMCWVVGCMLIPFKCFLLKLPAFSAVKLLTVTIWIPEKVWFSSTVGARKPNLENRTPSQYRTFQSSVFERPFCFLPFENRTFYHSKTERQNGRLSLGRFIYKLFFSKTV